MEVTNGSKRKPDGQNGQPGDLQRVLKLVREGKARWDGQCVIIARVDYSNRVRKWTSSALVLDRELTNSDADQIHFRLHRRLGEEAHQHLDDAQENTIRVHNKPVLSGIW